MKAEHYMAVLESSFTAGATVKCSCGWEARTFAVGQAVGMFARHIEELPDDTVTEREQALVDAMFDRTARCPYMLKLPLGGHNSDLAACASGCWDEPACMTSPPAIVAYPDLVEKITEAMAYEAVDQWDLPPNHPIYDWVEQHEEKNRE